MFWHIFWRSSFWQLRSGSAHCDRELAKACEDIDEKLGEEIGKEIGEKMGKEGEKEAKKEKE
jgi:hypothetical protein